MPNKVWDEITYPFGNREAWTKVNQLWESHVECNYQDSSQSNEQFSWKYAEMCDGIPLDIVVWSFDDN